MMLHLRPDLVRSDLIRDDPDDTPAGLAGLFWARDFGRKTDHGAVGHPEFADADGRPDARRRSSPGWPRWRGPSWNSRCPE